MYCNDRRLSDISPLSQTIKFIQNNFPWYKKTKCFTDYDLSQHEKNEKFGQNWKNDICFINTKSRFFDGRGDNLITSPPYE